MKADFVGLFLAACFISLSACASLPATGQCEDNWQITGYYTPVEGDFSGPRQTINIADHGRNSFALAFLREVKMEGWGKTRDGWYLGYYSVGWHRAEQPQDATGQPLVVGTAAVDPKVNIGQRLYIPAFRQWLNSGNFEARDVGGRIAKRHIDLYTGEGQSARKLTWRITGNQTVCLIES